ncbi:GNAT family N-acetyltransferase [Nocardia crassostreae]|uniref:GNAT family N-acetyltransferase n=1 Tax=Nocardia crassostreae TaxID=53428 RepID=UPI0008341A39|nr:GNAT family N-acetyltransferase [Nocardia crassostreae]
MRIVLDDLTGSEVIALLESHVAEMFEHSPEDSVHALDLEGLRKPEVTFWSVREGEELAGCGAVKELDPTHGEIKSMRTAANFRGQGVASLLLDHILDEARARGYERLSLETGAPEFFAPAVRLYERHGFTRCAPFADYVEDPYSIFMTRAL